MQVTGEDKFLLKRILFPATYHYPVINIKLEFKINDFLNTTERVPKVESGRCEDSKRDLSFNFSASVYPNGVDEGTEGWLVVLPDSVLNDPGCNALTWIVSIIDIEGNPKFSRSFGRHTVGEGQVGIQSDENFSFAKYCERSFVLSRADELLPEGVLTLLCDFYYEYKKYPGVDTSSGEISKGGIFDAFFRSVREIVLLNPDFLSGHYPNPDEITIRTICDLTSRVLIKPPFRDSRKRFYLYAISSMPSPISSDSEEGGKDILEDGKNFLEDVWIIDVGRDRFLLSFEDRLGRRLLEASLFVERCVNTEGRMREQIEKRIEFPNTHTATFLMVLYYFETGILLAGDFDTALSVYEFSHLYEMKALRRKCAEELIYYSDIPNECKKLREMADFYSDEYLSTLLEVDMQKFESEKKQSLGMFDSPCSHCYI